MAPRQREHGVAKEPADAGFGSEEVGRAGGVQDVLVRRVHALLGVAVEQRLRRVAAQHEVELPAQVVGVLHARIGPLRAERRDLMRGVAGEEGAPGAERPDTPAVEGVDAGPDQFVLGALAQHRVHAGAHRLGAQLGVPVDVPAELEVDAPHVVGLLVQQRRLSGAFERGLEPEPALGGEGGRHPHVGDQEVVLEHAALEREAGHAAHRRARAVAGGEPVGLQRVGPVRRIDL